MRKLNKEDDISYKKSYNRTEPRILSIYRFYTTRQSGAGIGIIYIRYNANKMWDCLYKKEIVQFQKNIEIFIKEIDNEIKERKWI